MVGTIGLEPMTSTLSGWLSDQLIYVPIVCVGQDSNLRKPEPQPGA